jgi:acyl-CoA synthetase (AMP-forming)/AMP-acid ligase II
VQALPSVDERMLRSRQSPRFVNLGDLIDRTADPDKIALIDLVDSTQPRNVSFRQLDEMAQAVARGLVRRGFKRGDRIAILAANRTEYLAAYYGIMRAGLVAVPVNYKFPPKLVEFVVRDSGARLVFCDVERRAACPDGLPVVCFAESGERGFDAFLDPGVWQSIVPAPDEPAMFLYTSGSTGRPKGVILSHQSHLWTVETRLESLDLGNERILIAAPLYHMNALALAKLGCAAHATIVMLPQFTASAYIDAISRYHCTFITAVPPMIAMMLQHPDLLARADLTSVSSLRMGSAPVSPSLMDAIHATFPNAHVINAFGTTEGGPVVFGPHPAGLKQPLYSVGYPHPKVQVRLIDAAGHEADEGVLQLKSPALMSGYHNRADLPLPITADGYYITGDVFRRDRDGFYYFMGRTDDMFVSGGENIFPGEVEKMLETHPDIAQACVVPVEDAIKGQKPVAFVVARNAALTEQAVQAFALANAPAYQHPRRVWFLDRLPLASTNKIDRRALMTLAKERMKRKDG